MPRLQTGKLGSQVGATGTRPSVKAQATLDAPRTGRPTKNESEELGLRILDVAANLFAKKGFAATSMEHIIAECGMGKDTIYRRYSSKSDIFAELIKRLHEIIVPELDKAVEYSKDPLVCLRHYARTLLTINLRTDLLSLNRVALGEAMAFGGVKPTAAEEDPVMIRFAYLVESAQKAGTFVSGDACFLAEQLLYATSVRPVIATMQGSEAYLDVRFQDQYFEEAWDLFMTGATRRPA